MQAPHNKINQKDSFPFTKKKTASLLLIISLLCSAFFAAGISYAQSGIGNQKYPTAYNNGGPSGAYDYLVFTFTNNTGTFYAAKDSFGRIIDSWTSTNASYTIQMVADNCDKDVIAFSGGARIPLQGGVIIDVDKVMGIQGNNAHIIVDGNYTAFTIQGKLVGSANPTSGTNPTIKTEEFFFTIDTLHFRGSNETPYVGTGVEIQKTLGIKIINCNFYDLNSGIAINERNRNIILQNNNIWNLNNYGIHLKPETNLHQIIVSGNHISYAKIAVYVENSELANLMVTSNIIENSNALTELPTNLIKIVGTIFSQEFIISQNTLQDHNTLTDSIISISHTNRTKNILISGNYLGNTGAKGVVLENTENVNINGNTFDRISGVSIQVNSVYSSAVQVTGNSFLMCGTLFEVNDDTRGAVFRANNAFDCTGGVVFNTKSIISSAIDQNTFTRHRGLGIQVNIGTGSITATSFSNNNIGYYSSTASISIAISINATGRDLTLVSVSDNLIRGFSPVTLGLYVNAANYTGVFIQNNAVYGVSNGYTIPSPIDDKLVVENNFGPTYT